MIGLPVKMKGNLKCTSSNFWSLLGTQNKDIGAALQTTLTEVKLHLQHRLDSFGFLSKFFVNSTVNPLPLIVLLLVYDPS